MKYEVIFTDCGDNETVVEQKFDTEEEATRWADSMEYDFQDEFKTFYRYYNPEDKNSDYVGYEVRPIM